MIPIAERRHLRALVEETVALGEAQSWPAPDLGPVRTDRATSTEWARPLARRSSVDWLAGQEAAFARDLCRVWVERAVSCFDQHLAEQGRGWLLRAAEEEARVRGSPGAYCDLWWWVSGGRIAAPEERRRPDPRRWRPWR